MILVSILLSLLFIPAAVLWYFCFLMSLIFIFHSGVKEGALVPSLLKKTSELYRIFFLFLLGGIFCTVIPILWFYYLY